MERKSGHDESKVERARQWLEGLTKKGAPGFQGDDVGRADADADADTDTDTDTFFDLVCFSGLTVSRATNAHIVCYFQIPVHLADADGNWHAGAIATIIDNVGAAAIMTVTGSIPISVDFNISYFSPAKSHDEVEVEARVVEYKGIVTMVAVEIRKKHDGQLVASGRQWMATARPSRLRSKM